MEKITEEGSKRGRGRPPGGRFPHIRSLRLTARQHEKLDRLADRWGCDGSGVVRRLIEEAQ